MEKKKSVLFWAITFGGPVILGILMGIVFYSGNSTGIFPVVWMFLPAAAVMIGQLVTKKQDDGQIKLPKRFIITFLVITVVEVLVPIDGTDTYYLPEQASNFYEVFGNNTDYLLDPEECMADNFKYAMYFGIEGQDGQGYPNPEIIQGIIDELK